MQLQNTSDIISPWFEGFWRITLGAMHDMGISYFDSIANDQYQSLIEQTLDNTYNPYLLASDMRPS